MVITSCTHLEKGNMNNKFVQYSDNACNNILYRTSKKINIADVKSSSVQKLIKNMHKRMTGIGLAANQVGEPIQLFIIEFKKYKDPEKYKNLNLDDVHFQVFINPRIISASCDKVTYWHGCLSASDKPIGKVATYKWIDYEALDEHGAPKTGRLCGMAAIIFQHEFRHLLGKCYFDFAKEFLAAEDLRRKIINLEIKLYEDASTHDPLLLPDYTIGETIEEYQSRTDINAY